MTQPRKSWLHHHFGFAQLVGIGGPGAPHSMRLDRIGSTGAVLKTTFSFRIIVSSCHIFQCSSPHQESEGKMLTARSGPSMSTHQAPLMSSWGLCYMCVFLAFFIGITHVFIPSVSAMLSCYLMSVMFPIISPLYSLQSGQNSGWATALGNPTSFCCYRPQLLVELKVILRQAWLSRNAFCPITVFWNLYVNLMSIVYGA